MTAAWALLAEAATAGVKLRLARGEVKVAGRPSPELLHRLRARKVELVALLSGDTCRRCGEPMAWPGPCGVIYADGSAEHPGCRLLAAGQRAITGVVATSEHGELLETGEP